MVAFHGGGGGGYGGASLQLRLRGNLYICVGRLSQPDTTTKKNKIASHCIQTYLAEAEKLVISYPCLGGKGISLVARIREYFNSEFTLDLSASCSMTSAEFTIIATKLLIITCNYKFPFLKNLFQLIVT